MCIVAVLCTFFIHELGHWIVGAILGQPMKFELNCFPAINEALADRTAIRAAGALMTIGQALAVFAVMHRHNKGEWYPFLLAPFVMRVLSGILTFFKSADESQLSLAFGLGQFALPIAVYAGMFLLIRQISRRYQFEGGFSANTVILITLATSMILLSAM